MAAGIDGDEGDNRITNTAPMTVTSVASTVAGSIAERLRPRRRRGRRKRNFRGRAGKTGDAGACAFLGEDRRLGKSGSPGYGNPFGAGFDTIASGGDIAVDATSHAVAAGVSVNVAKMDKGLSGSAALAEAGAEALSTAIGVDGGDGDNGITNSAAIGAKAAATAVGVGVSVDVGLADKGVALGPQSRQQHNGRSPRIRHPQRAGQHRVVNTGNQPRCRSQRNGRERGTDRDECRQGTGRIGRACRRRCHSDGHGPGDRDRGGRRRHPEQRFHLAESEGRHHGRRRSVWAWRHRAGCLAGRLACGKQNHLGTTAVGIDSGSGNDRVSNTGQIALDSQSSATAVSVGLSVTYAKQGVGASVALVDAQSGADATARGIDAGDGDDRITNSGRYRESPRRTRRPWALPGASALQSRA